MESDNRNTTDRPTGQQVKDAASSASDKLKTSAQDMANTVSTEASNYAEQARDSAASEVKDVASALRTAASDLRSGSPQERTFSQIADSLADASDAVRNKDLGEVMESLNGFARRNPLIFLGSAALVGFAATRFAKASSSPTSGNYGSGSAHMDRPVPSDRDTLGTPAIGRSGSATSTSGSATSPSGASTRSPSATAASGMSGSQSTSNTPVAGNVSSTPTSETKI